nr:transposase [Paenibacillus donghaensis]
MTHFKCGKKLTDVAIETIGKVHDGPIGEQLADKNYILVQDRAYGKIKRFDQYAREQQYFVTRIKENVMLVKPHSLKRQSVEDSNVTKDITCYLDKAHWGIEVFFRWIKQN